MTSIRGCLFPKVPFISHVQKWQVGAVYSPEAIYFPSPEMIGGGRLFPKVDLCIEVRHTVVENLSNFTLLIVSLLIPIF